MAARAHSADHQAGRAQGGLIFDRVCCTHWLRPEKMKISAGNLSRRFGDVVFFPSLL
jgi:hypothetical protein